MENTLTVTSSYTEIDLCQFRVIENMYVILDGRDGGCKVGSTTLSLEKFKF